MTIQAGRILNFWYMVLLGGMTVLRQVTRGGHAVYGLRRCNFLLMSGQNSRPTLDSRSTPS